MAKANPQTYFVFDQENHSYLCQGDWSIIAVNGLLKQFKRSALPQAQQVTINGQGLSGFDFAAALALAQWIDALKTKDNQVELFNFSKQQHDLLKLIQDKKDVLHYIPPVPEKKSVAYQVGEETVYKLNQFHGLIALIGALCTNLFIALRQWQRFQFPSIVSNIDKAGLKALPIVALLSFLIGVVLAYQMGLQLQTYGASIFIAYLSGMAIFREFAPLITAIIVAGRTSSSYTAQIGSMVINEEIDALKTMGLSPTELLVVPKVLGLLIVFPLLIFWSDLFSTLGAMVMSKYMLQVNYFDFLARLRDSVGFKQMMLGLYKAPAFAILIALVGCFQGFRVQPNADSVGTQTTRSVVQALFLIIVADAAFSIVYSWLDL